ncbi:hypothetical protein K2X89_06560 [Myxococcota bacterium]|nr:hypothetical protein [Myxococcota bacterium]
MLLLIVVIASGIGCAGPTGAPAALGVEPVGDLRESPSGDQLLLIHEDIEDALVVGECADESVGAGLDLADSIRAIVVHRNCGATVDFATWVVLAREGEREVVAVFKGRQPVRLERLPNGGVSVVGPSFDSESIVRRDSRIRDLDISYAVDSALVPSPGSPRQGFSNFNFGATGRAAGIPAEVLLKIAGWSQRASENYRAEWGSWTGDAPYGDDPVGSRQIRDGMSYYDSGQWRNGR